jgi:hypothetical protein
MLHVLVTGLGLAILASLSHEIRQAPDVLNFCPWRHCRTSNCFVYDGLDQLTHELLGDLRGMGGLAEWHDSEQVVKFRR